MVIYTLCSIFNTSKYNLGLIVMDSTEFTTDVRLKRTSDLCSLAKQLMQKIFGFPAVQRLEDADRTVVDEGISNNKHMISFFLFFAEVSSFPQNSTDHLACPINYCAFFFFEREKYGNTVVPGSYSSPCFQNPIFIFNSQSQCYYYQAVVIQVI